MSGHHAAVVLIGDGTAEQLIRTGSTLQDHHEIRLAADGAAVLRQVRTLPRPGLVLVDASLAGPDAFEVLRQMKADPDTAGIPVLFTFTLADDAAIESRALAAGAADVLPHPLMAETLLVRMAKELRLRHAQALLKDQRRLLEHVVHERTAELARMTDAVIWAMATLAEMGDADTPDHLQRMQHYVAALARRLQPHPRFARELTDANVALLFKAAPLHDIGKAAIPEAILSKPGKLTPEEFAIVKQHTVHGRAAIDRVRAACATDDTFLRFAAEITYSHHEKFDGSGYPEGLIGDAIPLSARLLAVADVYDALISHRVYKPAFTHETAVELIRQGSGEHFDPDIVDAMLAIEAEFAEIAARFSTENR